MKFFPTEEKINKHYSSFIVDSKNLKGIESNSDVDAVLFGYQTSNKGAASKIESKLLQEKWIVHFKSYSELVVFKT